MQIQIDPRLRKRVPCTLDVGGGPQRGLVLNLSRGGLFVQTSLPANPGTPISIDLSSPFHDAIIALSGTVVWRRRISPRMIGINQSGMGVRLDTPPAAWEDLLRDSGASGTAQPLEAPQATSIRWAVRLARAGSTRTRRVVVHCETEAEARARAIAEVGTGWEILELSSS